MEPSNQMISVQIPKGFSHPLFFSHSNQIIILNNQLPFSEAIEQVPFMYDIAAYYQMNFYKPWEQIEESIPIVLEAWNKYKEDLASKFQKRDRKAASGTMVQSIVFFISILFWINKRHVAVLLNWEHDAQNLEIKPINTIERLTFIVDKPNHYHSFVQLSQLFEELTKQYYKLIYIKSSR